MIKQMGVGALISVDEYLLTSFHPGCDFVEGEVRERNVGKLCAWSLSATSGCGSDPIKS